MNLFDYMFAVIYTSKFVRIKKSIFGASIFIGTLLSFNLMAAGQYISILLDIRPGIFFNIWGQVFLNPLSVAAVCLIYMFRCKKTIIKYYRSGDSIARPISAWAYIILSFAVFAKSSMAAAEYNADKLEREKVVILAEVTDIDIKIAKGYRPNIKDEKSFFRYKFVVDGKEYTKDIEQSRYKAYYIKPGDSCMIMYAKSCPDLNDIATNKRGELIVKKTIFKRENNNFRTN